MGTCKMERRRVGKLTEIGRMLGEEGEGEE